MMTVAAVVVGIVAVLCAIAFVVGIVLESTLPPERD